MLAILEGQVVNWVIMFAVRQLSKYGSSTDWTIVETDAATRVRDLVPGRLFDDTFADLVVGTLEGVRHVLQQTNALQDIVQKAAAQDWVGAVAAVKTLILGTWAPLSDTGKKTFAVIDREGFPAAA